MNRLLTMAGGDPKRLREALSQLKSSKLDPKQQDQVYQALDTMLSGGCSDVRVQEEREEEEESVEDVGILGEDRSDEESRNDMEELDNEHSEVEPNDELVEELTEEEVREREKRRQECFQDFRNYVEYAKKIDCKKLGKMILRWID